MRQHDVEGEEDVLLEDSMFIASNQYPGLKSGFLLVHKKWVRWTGVRPWGRRR